MNKLPLFQKGYSGGINFKSHNTNISAHLLFFFIFAVIFAFIILFLRLFQLSIVKGNYYRRLSEQNRVRELLIEPKRGALLDRKGFTIAKNSTADLSSVLPRIRSSRLYEYPEAVAPFVGFRQIADPNDLKTDPCLNKLTPGDKIGKKGIEKVFDCQLRGTPGKKIVEVNASGEYLKTLYVVPPVDGENIRLALDLELQKKAYELIKSARGAVVASVPKTGEILVLTSAPSYNPQDFEDQNSARIQSYFANLEKPLFDRVTEGTYPPGSLFKLVLAAGALEEKKIDNKFQIEDTGSITAGPLKFGNWYFLQYGKTDGFVDITKAIRRSNDIFFYKTGELLGVDKIKAWAQILGYGKKTGIGFDESEGIIPSPFWKEEVYRDRWYLGDTYNLSIGQGYLLVTPIQVNQVTSVFANDGYLCRPQLLKSTKPECKKINIAEKNLGLVREGMKEACSTGGTGWPLFDFKVRMPTSEVENKLEKGKTSEVKIQTACKTGTAESHAESGKPHAWITVFAPLENPEIVLTVLVEESGQGSDVAGPIAKELLNTYFERSQ